MMVDAKYVDGAGLHALRRRGEEAPARRTDGKERGGQRIRAVPGPGMQLFVIQLLSGLASAASLFLVAAGLSLIFGVTRIINFAHGSLYMLGTYIAVTLVTAIGGPLGFWGGIVASAIVVGLIGAADRDSAPAPHLSRAGTVPASRHLRATSRHQRSRALWMWGPEDLLGPRAPGLARRDR